MSKSWLGFWCLVLLHFFEGSFPMSWFSLYLQHPIVMPTRERMPMGPCVNNTLLPTPKVFVLMWGWRNDLLKLFTSSEHNRVQTPRYTAWGWNSFQTTLQSYHVTAYALPHILQRKEMDGNILIFLPPILLTAPLSASTPRLIRSGMMAKCPFSMQRLFPFSSLGHQSCFSLWIFCTWYCLLLTASLTSLFPFSPQTSCNSHSLSLNNASHSGRQVPQNFLEELHILPVSTSPQFLWGISPIAVVRMLVMGLLVMSRDTIGCHLWVLLLFPPSRVWHSWPHPLSRKAGHAIFLPSHWPLLLHLLGLLGVLLLCYSLQLLSFLSLI